FQLQDINGDGLLDLVRIGRSPEGVFERVNDNWAPFRAFPAAPRIDWTDPNLRFLDRKSTRLNSSHRTISYAVFCLKKKNIVRRRKLSSDRCWRNFSKYGRKAGLSWSSV